MLDRLRHGNEAGVKSRHTLIFFHNFLAFLHDSEDRLAGFSASGLVYFGKDLLETSNMFFRLRLMLLERGFQIMSLRRFRHFRERAEDLLFGEINILESIVKQLT